MKEHRGSAARTFVAARSFVASCLQQCVLLQVAGAGLLLGLAQSAQAEGWYLRGGLGYEHTRSARFADVDCTSTQPPALFGCVAGSDGRRIGAYGDFGKGWMGEVAVGRALSPWLRAEVSYARRGGLDFRGNANFLAVGAQQPVEASFTSQSIMMNLYADLSPLAGLDTGRFQPYVGVGLGAARNRLGSSLYRFPENTGRHQSSVVPGSTQTGLAYMLTVGTGVRIDTRLTLDFALRYSDLGRVETDRGAMQMNHVPAGIVINPTRAELRSHGVMIGLRYAL